MLDEIEQELLDEFPGLDEYFKIIFLWIENVYQSGAIKIMALQTNKTQRAITHAFLLGQVTAQIKTGDDVLAPHKKLIPLWEFLLNKLVDEKYLDDKRVKEMRADMEPYLHGR